MNAQYGTNVAVKAYWKRCGFGPQKPKGLDFDDKDSIKFQFDDVASYQIKCDMPLAPIFALENEACSIAKETKPDSVETCVDEKEAFNPASFKIFSDHTLPMQVPGHWYGDKREFNFLTVLNTTSQTNYYRSKYCDFNEDFETFKSMVVMTGHAELTAQAYYLG